MSEYPKNQEEALMQERQEVKAQARDFIDGFEVDTEVVSYFVAETEGLLATLDEGFHRVILASTVTQLKEDAPRCGLIATKIGGMDATVVEVMVAVRQIEAGEKSKVLRVDDELEILSLALSQEVLSNRFDSEHDGQLTGYENTELANRSIQLQQALQLRSQLNQKHRKITAFLTDARLE